MIPEPTLPERREHLIRITGSVADLRQRAADMAALVVELRAAEQRAAAADNLARARRSSLDHFHDLDTPRSPRDHYRARPRRPPPRRPRP